MRRKRKHQKCANVKQKGATTGSNNRTTLRSQVNLLNQINAKMPPESSKAIVIALNLIHYPALRLFNCSLKSNCLQNWKVFPPLLL